MNRYLFILGALMLFVSGQAKGQDIAAKTNILYDATASINLGVEVGLAPKWTLDLSGNLNAWSKNEQTKWKHWMIQPEGRYWFCDRFSRHFVGFHAICGQFNFGGIKNSLNFLGTDLSALSDGRYQGHAYGLGAAYGFAYILNRSWNLELELGIGYIHADYEHFACTGCGRKLDEGKHHYFGPTKAAINLVYLF